ncbi:MAG TPA: metalloregulator ArsR/SmtB family transcription factor [Polyangiaceae bacterium]
MHPSSPNLRFTIAGFGELVADPSRVAILLSLMDGLARPASELAQIAGVAPSTASAHLQRLRSGGLVRSEQEGRHRYFRLAGEHVADALEAIGMQMTPAQRCLPASAVRDSLTEARTCYRHLAGRLGVAWMVALERRGFIMTRDGATALTPEGARALGELGLTLPASATGRSCLDWTERRYHLGGKLGAQLTEHMFSGRWIVRRGKTRGVRVTTGGRHAFAKLGIALDVIESAT